MYIVPMNSGITPLNTMGQMKKVEPSESDGASFVDIFKDAMQTVQDTQQTCTEDSIKVAMGEIDDLHTVGLNTKKAAIALETFVSMKNTALEAYNEVMRMSI